MQEVNRYNIRIYRDIIDYNNYNNYFGSYIYLTAKYKTRWINRKSFGIKIKKKYENK